MIKFGMKLPEIFNQLVRGYQKVRGQKPTGLDLIKIKQEAMQKFQDMRKILDMQGKPIDPSQPIMGGSQQGNALKSGIMKATGAGPEVVEGINPKFIDFTINSFKNMDGIKVMREGNKIIKREGPYKDLTKNDAKRILDAVDDKLKNIDMDPEDMFASGGRAGFKDGLTPSDYLKVKDMLNHYHDYKKSGKPKISKAKFAQEFFRENNADGGRIGLEGGTNEDFQNYLKERKRFQKERSLEQLFKEYKEDLRRQEVGEQKQMAADGGRIGYAMGSEGIMQMASAPDPMDERNMVMENIAIQEFGKPLKDLSEDEIIQIEIFMEEMSKRKDERLMNKFASAPDPMDERNSMMETIAMQEFGKPLKDLSEDEIIQIDEMMEDMSSMPDREAPSIKLADGGRAAYKDGEGMFKTLFYNKAAPILSGFNTSELFDLVTNLSSSIPFADGGRAAFKDGPKDPRRRTFMKAAAGIASMLPFGATKIIGKAAPVIAKGAELAAPALNKIIDTVMTLGKTISQSGKRVKEMVTKKKHKDIEVEEDVMDGSYIIKKDSKEIYYKPGRRDEMGIEDDVIEVIDKTIKKAGGGIARMLGE